MSPAQSVEHVPPPNDVSDRTGTRPPDSQSDTTRPPLVVRQCATKTKGSGRVKPRQAQMEAHGDIALKDLPRVLDLRVSSKAGDASHSSQLHDLPTDPPAAYPHYVTRDDENAVPIFDWRDVTQRNAANDKMRKGVPVVLRNTKIAVPSTSPGTPGIHISRDGLCQKWGDSGDDPDDDSKDRFQNFANSSFRDARKWRVLLSSTSPNKRNRFLPIVPGNNAYGGHYRVRQPETAVTRFSTTEFAKCAREWQNRGCYLEDEVASIAIVAGETDTVPRDIPGKETTRQPRQPKHGVRPVSGGDGLGKEVVDGLNWEAVDEVATLQKFGPLKSVSVGAGTRNSLLPFYVPTASGILGGALSTDAKQTVSGQKNEHAPSSNSGALDNETSRTVPDSHGLSVSEFDVQSDAAAKEAFLAATDDSGFETMQVQIVGRRKVLLVSPDQTYTGMYPYPVGHPLDGRSMVDWADVAYDRFPNAAGVTGRVCVLAPGDVLFVPEGWWRHEQGLSHTHAHVQLRFGRSPLGSIPGSGIFVRTRGNSQTQIPPDFAIGRPRHADASLFFVGRRVEKRVVGFEGLAEARRWLEIIAQDEIGAWCDLSTVDGARRVEIARRIREEIDFGLPPPKISKEAFREQLDTEFKVGAGGTGTGTLNRTNPKVQGENPGRSVAPFHDETLALARAPPRNVTALALASHRELRGKGRYEKFLRELIDGRMAPTPWLDDGFVDPLFVSEAIARLGNDNSKQGNDSLELMNPVGSSSLRVALPGGGGLTAQKKFLPDDRTDVERRFPEMFVDTLKKKGWGGTKHTPVSVLNPEHPQFVGKK